jgi:hypothetical protein
VLARQHLLDLGALDLALERVEPFDQLATDVLPLRPPLDEDAEIVAALAQRLDQVAILLQPPASLQQALRLGLVLPEVRLRDARLDPGELLLRLRGLKDSRADRPRA